MATPRLFLPNENGILDLFGATLHFKATPSDTNGAYSVIDGAFDPGGFTPLPHAHDAEDESFYILDGEFSFRIGESESVGRPGDLPRCRDGRSARLCCLG
jgi:quercetin dioxygenase-like cupin family protein